MVAKVIHSQNSPYILLGQWFWPLSSCWLCSLCVQRWTPPSQVDGHWILETIWIFNEKRCLVIWNSPTWAVFSRWHTLSNCTTHGTDNLPGRRAQNGATTNLSEWGVSSRIIRQTNWRDSWTKVELSFRYALMLNCWDDEPSERPAIDEIGAKLRQMLNIEDEYYGYVTLQNPKSVRYMLNREVSLL